MKKIYTLASVLVVAVAANAQSTNKFGMSPGNANVLPNQSPQIITPTTQAVGDTTFLFDGFYVYDIAGNLPVTFVIQQEDVDGLTPDPAIQGGFGTASGFNFFYDIDPTSPLLYGHPDSVFFAGACSWFSPLAQADNWLEMGPIPVPAGGAHLQWRHNMPDGAYRDGYKVKLSSTGPNNYTDFIDPAIYTVADMAASTSGDTVNTPYTVFNQRQVDIPASYNGTDVYIAYHHDANDMFILYLTDIMMIEGTVGVSETAGNVSVKQNFPNPANGITEIDFSLINAVDNVTLNIYEVSGKLVSSVSQNNVGAGTHAIKFNASEMPAGMYYYTLTAGGNSVSKKMVVTH
ncbi:MAG: putative aminopeptidase [Bacteroidetes bacterium]|nr:MAG: putative aminopeptidase [Bacteroidota bacterium]